MIGLARRTLDDLWADLRFAGRTLLKTPGFLVAVVSLGLAVGACTAVYGTVDWLLNRPPTGVVDPDRVVGMMWAERGRENDSRARFSFSHPQYETLREVQDAFAEVAAYGKLALYAGGEGWGEELVFQFVSGTYFPLLGVRPHLGRLIRRIMTVLGHGLLVAAIGTALGVAVALVVTPRIGPQLYDVSPTDPTTFTSVPTLILLVAALSVAYAALTAIRSDPAEYLSGD